MQHYYFVVSDRSYARGCSDEGQGDLADWLYACLRMGSYQLSSESTMLKRKKEERGRRPERGSARAQEARGCKIDGEMPAVRACWGDGGRSSGSDGECRAAWMRAVPAAKRPSP